MTLHHFAHAIAEAETAADKTAAAAADADEHLATIAARVDAMAGERAAIAARRAAGHHAPDDGARLAVIAVDSEMLAGMLADASTAATLARQRAAGAASQLAQAREVYAREEARIELAALDGHAEKLLELLAATLAHRRTAAEKLPPPDRDFGQVAGRLRGLDAAMVGEMMSVRAVQLRRHGMQFAWKPTDQLYDAVWRSHQGNGVFV
jgi:hypothetical protein